ncbi:exonuclease domain-containing protein [Nocardia tengchongensis]|uniref:exonuclease domain-containing protein n=1 Tax=Nocardia tengchongensis TaxID=2055889 RepID=UPI0036ADCFD2
MAGLSFAAIDVDTANSARGSICAVGVTVVENGEWTASRSWLCRPPAGVDFFNWHNIRVHGITAARVADQPVFADRWPEVARLVGDLPVVAHNAGFDSGAIREACGRSGIEAPVWAFSCSLALSRRHLELDSYRLPNVAAALGIDFTDHHDAGADAAAAAGIVVALAARAGVDSLADLERMVAGTAGRAPRPARAASSIQRAVSGDSSPSRTVRAAGTPDRGETWTRRGEAPMSRTGHQPGGSERRSADTTQRRSWFGREELVIPEVTGTDPTHPLFGDIVVFTGDLAALTRQQAWDAIAACGATPARNVTKRTTRLVIGDGFRGADPTAFTTTKAARVAELRARGQRIEVMDERTFLACLGANSGSPARAEAAPGHVDAV